MADKKKFEMGDASRIIAVINDRVEKAVKSGAKVEYTWGTVASVEADGRTAGAYLYGETDGAYISEGFRVPEASYVTVGEKVKVAMDYQTGERWIAERHVSSAYKKVHIDLVGGFIKLGSGSEAPMLSLDASGSTLGILGSKAETTLLAVRSIVGQTGAIDIGETTKWPAIRFEGKEGTSKIIFGSGATAGALDVNLYRASADVLKTDDVFHAVAGLRVTSPSSTDGQSWTALRIVLPNNGYSAFEVFDGPSQTYPVLRFAGYGGFEFGPSGTSATADTTLARVGAGILKVGSIGGSDETLRIGDDAELYDVDVGHALGIKSQTTPANGMLIFGSDKDTNLYRSAANVLKTDDAFDATWYRYQGNTVYPALGLPVTARASSQLTLTTSNQDVAGATITRNSPVAETVLIIAVMDFNTSALGTGYSVANINFDGTDDTSCQIIGGRRSTLVRGTYSQMITKSVSAGSHTYKLRASKTVNDGTTTVEANHTAITIIPLAT